MSPWLTGYLDRARSPWASVAFVVPILLTYEIGLYLISPSNEEIRTGADAWLRALVHHIGWTIPFVAPVLLLAGLIAWAWLADEPWRDPVGTWIGMAIESVLLAGLFFVVVQILFPLLAFLGERIHDVIPRLEISTGRTPEMTWEIIVRFLGAGIYEETIFRLIGFTLLRWVFLAGDLSEGWSSGLAAAGSSLAFAAAHHWGGAEAVHATVFLYRVLAGLYFATVFQTRGFGVAVGAHIGYDVLVGLVLR